MRTNNPWETGDTYLGIKTCWCDTVSRIDAIREMQPDELRACLAWPDTQKTVRQAIERRLRTLAKENREGCNHADPS